MWLGHMGIGTTYIELGSRWQNGHVESFHNHFGDECLNQQLFLSVTEAQVVTEEWRFFLQPGSFAKSIVFPKPGGLCQRAARPGLHCARPTPSLRAIPKPVT